MTEVRKHQRTTASGKTTTVRQHHRDTPEAARAGWERRVASAQAAPAPHVSSVAPAEPAGAEGSWWADDAQPAESPALERMAQEMRDWRALPEPEPGPAGPMSPEMAKLLGCDTPEGRAKYERLRAYREAGYTGPLDEDNNIPDPDDPAERPGLEMLADMQERRG
jgi:hypothetical protein